MKAVFGFVPLLSGITILASKSKKSRSKSSKDSEPPPRITSNVKQNLQLLKWSKEFQNRKSSTPKPATRYRRKRIEEDLPPDTEIYQDPPSSLYDTNQDVDTALTAVPVMLVDGYNVCGYWKKLKKDFMGGRLDIARQKLIEELVEFSMGVVLANTTLEVSSLEPGRHAYVMFYEVGAI